MIVIFRKIVNGPMRNKRKNSDLCYKIKVIRERRMREKIENERVRSNFCLYMCLIINRTSSIYRYNMVTQKEYKIK